MMSALSGQEWKGELAILWAHLLAFTATALFVGATFTGIRGVNRLDYRIYQVVKNSDVALLLATVLIAYGIPLAASLIAIVWTRNLLSAQTVMLRLNILAFALGLVVITALVVVVLSQRGKYPFPALLLQEGSALTKSAIFVTDLLLLLLGAANLFAFVSVWVSSIEPTTEHTVKIAMILVFSLVIIQVLLNSLLLPSSLQWLERLERDIVIHRLAEPEVRTRLEKYLLGQELGAWLQERVSAVKTLVEELSGFSNDSQSTLREIQMLGHGGEVAKIGRLREIATTLGNKTKAFEMEWQPLAEWLMKVAENPALDIYLRDLARAASGSITSDAGKAVGAARILSGRILSIVDELEKRQRGGVNG
jgi:hypothetical protein